MRNKVKVIYNPHAGAKKRYFSKDHPATTLEEIKRLLEKYEIDADFFPTQHPDHATILAKEAEKEKYHAVIVAGGDGTVGEAANGLVGSNITLGILPLGSYMNIARMLSIPLELEKAVMTLKMDQIKKIDVGVITTLSGQKLEKPYYFLESVGFGIEAQFQQHMADFEKGHPLSLLKAIKTLIEYLSHKTEVKMGDSTIRTRTSMINISNGPYSGASIPIAPEAKLNDHILTVTIFRMRNHDLLYYFLKLWLGFKRTRKPTIYQTEKVSITTKNPRPVHADARLYGETPVEVEIMPNAISVYTGYPDQTEPISSFKKPTILEP